MIRVVGLTPSAQNCLPSGKINYTRISQTMKSIVYFRLFSILQQEDKLLIIFQKLISTILSIWLSLSSNRSLNWPLAQHSLTSLKFVPKGTINNIPALVQIMAWRRPGDKPLSETMLVSLLTHICVTRPQWVKLLMHSQTWTTATLKSANA